MDYHVAKNGAPLGTLSDDAITSALAARALSPDDLCWREGMADWQPLGSVFTAAGAATDGTLPPPPPANLDYAASPAAGFQPSAAEAYPYAANPYAPPAARVAATVADAPQQYGDYAGFWLRVVAYIIDRLIGGLLGLAIGTVLGGIVVATDMGDESVVEVISAILGLVVNWLYYALMESSAKQATLGKLALGLVVTDMQRERISFGRASGRYFGMIVSGLILGIGFLMCAWTERKQCLHDSMAGCLVFRKIR